MISQNSKISIIVPCYNQAQYLDECLQSVQDQTYTHWECIIVNDGSPDNTEEIAKKWVEKDTRFIYLKKENGGVSSARNFGIERAKGEWILPLDGDDKIGTEYLELASLEFPNHYDIIYCNAEFFGETNAKFNLTNYSYQELLTNNIIFCSGFYKKSAWISTLGYDITLTKGFEDWDFWISLLKISTEKKVIRLDYLGFYYRRKKKSRDVSINSEVNEKECIFQTIYNKHQPEYFQQFGSFQTLLLINKLLKKKANEALQNKNVSIKKKIKKFFRK